MKRLQKKTLRAICGIDPLASTLMQEQPQLQLEGNFNVCGNMNLIFVILICTCVAVSGQKRLVFTQNGADALSINDTAIVSDKSIIIQGVDLLERLRNATEGSFH
jgi:hypothetical protein